MTSFDIKQLQDELEPFLSNAIAATIAKQPADPVEFLANHILHEIELSDQVYTKRVEQNKLLEKERVEAERNKAESEKELIASQKRKEEEAREADSQRKAHILEIYNAYIEGIEKILSEQDDIDPDEGKAEAEEEGEAETAENKEPVNEELEEEIFDIRVKIILAERKSQLAVDILKNLLQSGLFTQYREPLRANADGSEIPPKEPSKNVFRVLKALQILFDRPKKDLKVFHPQGLRRYIPLKSEDLVASIAQYNPSENQRNLKFRRAKQYLKKIDREELREEDITAYIIADFVSFSSEIRKLTKKLKTLRKEEIEVIPEDPNDPKTKSEFDYVDSEDERTTTNEGETAGEVEEEDEE